MRIFRALRWLIWTGVKLGLVVFVLFIGWAWFANAYQEAPAAPCAARPPIGMARSKRRHPGTGVRNPRPISRFPSSFSRITRTNTRRRSPPDHRADTRTSARSPGPGAATTACSRSLSPSTGSAPLDHRLPILIGLGFTAENAVKGVYENTIGRLTERFSDGGKSAEDQYAAKKVAEYATSLRTAPSYEFGYGQALGGLWRTPARGAYQARKIERRAILTIEYGLKGLYSWMLGIAAPDDAPPQIHALALVDKRSPEVISLPRDELFTAALSVLVGKGVTIYEIAGNDEIFLTALGPASALNGPDGGPLKPANTWRVEFVEPLLTEPSVVRIGLTVPPSCLARLLADLQASGATLERAYAF